MLSNMHPFLLIFVTTIPALLIGTAILHLLPRLGSPGRAVSEWLCRAPGLDVMVTYFTMLPLIAGPIVAARVSDVPYAAAWGFLGAYLGQLSTIVLWSWLHEAANRKHLRGPRIVGVLNQKIGRVRNHVGLWVMTAAVPVFWIVRACEILTWPLISRICRLPRYNEGEWVNCSRQKFEGLVGHDLIWCLYCDWMTGVWSLGTEMLRNIESFYCPIRFYHDKKCENCKIDFPDADVWVPANGTMKDVTDLLDAAYDGKNNTWMGHPARTATVTVNGKEIRVMPRNQ